MESIYQYSDNIQPKLSDFAGRSRLTVSRVRSTVGGNLEMRFDFYDQNRWNPFTVYVRENTSKVEVKRNYSPGVIEKLGYGNIARELKVLLEQDGKPVVILDHMRRRVELRKLRVHSGLTALEVSRKTSVPYSTVGDYTRTRARQRVNPEAGQPFSSRTKYEKYRAGQRQKT